MRAILTYHSIDDSGSPISIDRGTWARHMAFFTSPSIRVVPLGEILDVSEGEHALAITFDDGFVNFAAEAWPSLRDAGLPATLFVPTRCVGFTNAWGGQDEPGIPTLPLLGWDELARLAEEGLDLGAHGRTHPHLDRLGRAEQQDEIEGSAQDLEDRIGQTPTSFCYPYGDLDGSSAALVSARYALGCTTRLATLPAAPDPHRLPRLDAFYYQAPGRLEGFGSLGFRAHLALRRTARGLRSTLRR